MTSNNLDQGIGETVEQARVFLNSFRSLVLATSSASGEPDASRVPFVLGQNCFYIYVSELAKHTRNLLERPSASVLLAQDDAQTPEVFARKRLQFRCTAARIDRTNEQWDQRIDEFEAQFGKVMGIVRELGDFHLLALYPDSGSYVRGFAKAYQFKGIDFEAFSQVTRDAKPKPLV